MKKKNATPSQAAPSSAEEKEARLLRARRQDIDAVPPGATGRDGGCPAGPSPAQGRWGLALSGGGIRSATFCIGVLQAIAEAPASCAQPPAPNPAPPATDGAGALFRASLLSRFDYLSTVSGGGYAGAFLCSLFLPKRLRPQATDKWHAADDAVRVLRSGPPGRIHAEANFGGAARLKAPLAWLRENGRYLVPTGAGDAVYAGALGIRNWAAVHYVVGTLLLAVLAMVALLRAYVPATRGWEEAVLKAALDGSTTLDAVWWSPFFLFALVPLLLLAVPFGVAFWLSYQGRAGHSLPFNRAALGALAAGLMFLGVAGLDHPAPGGFAWPLAAGLGGATPRQLFWLWAGATALLGVIGYVVTAFGNAMTVEQRVALTRHLANALIAVGALVAIAIVETLGQSLYLLWSLGARYSPVLTPAGLVAALVWLVKKGAAQGSKTSQPDWLRKLPLTTLGGAAGILIFFLVAALWSFALNWLIWMGATPDATLLFADAHVAFLWGLTAVTVLLAALTGQFPGFINLSSLQSFYSARLTRAYLGASNEQRFVGGAKALSVAEPLSKDDLRLEDFYAGGGLTTLAPLHIINVTLNKTVDPAEQLVQRDRKGQPLAVLPFGFAVEDHLMSFPTADARTEVQRPLGLGQWIGTSGAAFSTGIGRETSLGMSLLMGAANVRLGTWWDSGHGQRKPIGGLTDLLTTVFGTLFRTQTYLSYEFRARFFGMRRRWQYLSDGGHFENTGLYELLRTDRKVALVVACDNGADPDYRFGDLANLIRLARIDLGVEVSVVRDFSAWPGLAGVFGAPEQFWPSGKAASAQEPRPTCSALLLRAAPIGAARASTWVVMLKPVVLADAPADIRQYAKDHPNFPQEPTSDQFFDEAQWESYRSLGEWTARRVLAPAVLETMFRFMQADGGKAPASSVERASAAVASAIRWVASQLCIR